MSGFRVEKPMGSDAAGFNYETDANVARVEADANVQMVAADALERPEAGELAMVNAEPEAIEIETANAEAVVPIPAILYGIIKGGIALAAFLSLTQCGSREDKSVTAVSHTSGHNSGNPSLPPVPPSVLIVNDEFADMFNEVFFYGQEQKYAGETNITRKMRIHNLALNQFIDVDFSEKASETDPRVRDNSVIDARAKDVMGNTVGANGGHLQQTIEKVARPFSGSDAPYGMVIDSPADTTQQKYLYVQDSTKTGIYVLEWNNGRASAAHVNPEAPGSTFKLVKNNRDIPSYPLNSIPPEVNVVIVPNPYWEGYNNGGDEENNAIVLVRSTVPGPNYGQFFYESAHFEMWNERELDEGGNPINP